MKNEFTKSDLKTGMILVLNNDTETKVLLNTTNGDVCCGIDGDADEAWFPLDNLSHNLKYKGSHDVMKVYDARYNLYGASIKYKGELLWERKEEKPILEYNGIEYSKDTLISFIKKAQKI